MWPCTWTVGQLLKHTGGLRSLYPCIKFLRVLKLYIVCCWWHFRKKERGFCFCVWKSLWHHLLVRQSVTIRMVGEPAEGTAFRTISYNSHKCWPLPVISAPLLTFSEPQVQYQVFSSTWSEETILGFIPSEDKHQNSGGAKAITYEESDVTDPQLIYANVYALPIAKLWGFISAGDLAHTSKLSLNNVALINRVYTIIFTCMR